MFTDIVGFTDKVSTLSRKQIDQFIWEQKEIIEPIISEFSWKIVKTIWDAYMVVFTSPTKAVLCWVKIQDTIFKKNKDWVWEFFEIRIWINTWEVNIKSRDIFWEPVNIASRVESISLAWEVFLTESTYLNMNSNEIKTEKIWYRKLKWIKDKLLIYKVFNKNILIKKKTQIKLVNKYKQFFSENLFYWIIGLLSIIFLIFVFLFFTQDKDNVLGNNIDEEKSIITENLPSHLDKKNRVKNNLEDIDNEFSKIYSKEVWKDIKEFIKNHYENIENKDYEVAYENYLNKKYDKQKFKEMFRWVKSIIVNNPIINFWNDDYNYKLNIIHDNWNISNYIVTSKIVKSNWKYKISWYKSYLVWNVISKKNWEKFINNHYRNLGEKNFEIVFNNYLNLSKNLEEYKQMYSDLNDVEILNIKTLLENEYIIKLKLNFNDDTFEVYETIIKLRKNEEKEIKILSYFSQRIK